MKPNRGPVVDSGRVRYVSPSALQRFRACPRSWWYRYVARLPDKPMGRAAQLGVDGHARWEAAYLRGSIEPLGTRELQAVDRGLAPAPGAKWFRPEVSVDGRVKFGSIPLVGSVDLQCAGDNPLIVDWKYKSELPGERRQSIVDVSTDYGLQMCLYAYALYGEEPVSVRHVYIRHSGVQDCVSESGLFTRGAATESVAKAVEQYHEPMLRTARSGEFEVPQCPTREPCKAYGGCAYWARCRGVLDVLEDATREDDMGLFDAVDSKKRLLVVEATEPKPEVKTEAKPEVKPEAKPEAKPEVKTEVKTEVKPEVKTEVKTEAKPEVKRGRGRPRKASPAATPDPMLAEEPVPPTSGVRVYLRGIPVGRPTTDLSAYARTLNAQLCEKLDINAPDVRLSPDDRVAFGRWRPLLRALALECPPSPGDYVYHGGDELVNEVLEVVTESAELVVA